MDVGRCVILLQYSLCRCVSLHYTNYTGVLSCYSTEYAGVLVYTVQTMQVCYRATAPNMQVC